MKGSALAAACACIVDVVTNVSAERVAKQRRTERAGIAFPGVARRLCP